MAEVSNKEINKQINRITLRYAVLGTLVALGLVQIQKQFDYWVLSEGATVVAAMGIMMGYAARASYKSGYADAEQKI